MFQDVERGHMQSMKRLLFQNLNEREKEVRKIINNEPSPIF